MKIRKIVFWSHLAVGVAAGIVVLAMAATGVLLSYEVQITRWAESRVGIEPVGERLGADALAEAALVETGGQAKALAFQNAEAAPVTATMGRSGKVLIDPYTGDRLGDGDTAVSRFFGAVTSFHRWLSFTGFNATGKAATGAANLGFLFLLLSGSYLWLPRVWRWVKLKTLIFFRPRYPNGQVRDYHWHHIFAFWSVIPLIVIVGTGVTMSYDRAEGLAMTLAGIGSEDEAAEDTKGGANGAKQAGGVPDAATGEAPLQAALAVAMARDPAWRRVVLTLPADGASHLTAVVDTGPGRRMTRQETLTIALDDAQVIAAEGFSDKPKAARTFQFLRFGHTGEHYGFAGQTIAGLASLATMFMVYTGLALAWRRLVRPQLRRWRAA